MYRSNAYIRNGRLYRGNDDKIAFSWRRFLVVSTMVAFLAAANLKMIGEVEDQDKDRFQSLSMLSLHSKPRLTNYGLFSLQQTHNSVIFRGAFVKAKCSYESWEVGDLCMEVAANLCNEQPLVWNPSNLAHTATRIFTAVLILSSLLSFCCYGRAISLNTLDIPVIGSILSLFANPNLILDGMVAHVFVGPALMDLHRILPRLQRSWWFDDQDSTFAICAIVLVIGIGSLSNAVARRLSRKHVVGLNSVVAACIAYSSQINMNRTAVMFFVLNQPVTTVQTFWSLFLWNVIHQVSKGNDPVPTIVTWMFSAWAGSLFAQYQLGNQLWWGDVLHFAGIL
uniref:Peptidase S54 rhomboid domain-containing protein n=1 Tax=Craspedostauros australis TaxID=1486917 RepID=A0A7R9WNT9_9STRA|mmetsp:Transcript_10602/g.29229  ORF Transcript_10602/g.29229 Transcript_10602/m.29229 type:complete len:338 (+) Transcript_10602:163-1176(+)